MSTVKIHEPLRKKRKNRLKISLFFHEILF